MKKAHFTRITTTLLVFAAGTVVAAGRAGAVLAPLTDDAYTAAGSDANKGGKSSLRIEDAAISTWLKFGLSTLPPGTTAADVSRATLTVYLQKVSAGGSFDVHPVAASWTEATINGLAEPSLSAAVANVPVAAPPGEPTRYDYISVDLTSTVQNWIATPSSNHGVALVPAGGIKLQLDSKESKSTSQAPRLEIVLAISGVVYSTNIFDGTITGLDVQNGGLENIDIDFGTGSGFDNTQVGNGALFSNTTGQANTATGTGALYANTTGLGNTATGLSALSDNTTGSQNTAMGLVALSSNIAGIRNTAVGSTALSANLASGNTAIGASALTANTSGFLNTASGQSALAANTTGTENTATGSESLYSNTIGIGNTATGTTALFSNTTGVLNVATGALALYSNQTGDENVAIGNSALLSNETGGSNVAVGYGALAFGDAVNALTAVGYEALRDNTTGTFNTAVGYQALLETNDGANNTAVGYRALVNNVSGNYNTGIGQGALGDCTGDQNTAIGRDALSNVTTGDFNIGIGYQAGDTLSTGNNNIYIGNTGANESNTVRIGNLTHTSAFIPGIHSSTSTSGIPVLVNSSGKLGTTTSSRRFKTDIESIGDTSGALLRLRPVSFRYNQDIDPEGIKQYGLIAEEVAQVMPDLIVEGDDGKPYTVKYHLLTTLLLNELQRQDRRVADQQQELVQLATENRELRDRLGSIEAVVHRVATELDNRPLITAAARR